MITSEKKLKKKNNSLEKETGSSNLKTSKLEPIVDDELDIEEGESINNENCPVEITSLLKCNLTRVKVFHEDFYGSHLIIKIYEDKSVCPYCKLKLIK